jgi:SAM-dependent methyltransferase
MKISAKEKVITKCQFISRSYCPCCNTKISPNTESIGGGLDSNSTFTQIRDAWIGIGLQKHFKYYKCSECKSLITSAYPNQETAEVLYSSMPRNMESAVSLEHQKQNQDSYARHIADYAKTHGGHNKKISMLEIGADCGLLIESISAELGSYFINCAAIEPNSVVRKQLEAVLKTTSKSYMVENDIYNIKPECDRHFDIIAAIHVFDHVFNIKQMLIHLKSLLANEGFIYIVVHNPQSSVAWMLGNKWPPYCPQHPQLYTQNGIKKMAKDLGFKLMKTGRTTNNFSLAMLADFLKLAIPFADKINISLPLGNRYYILAAN